MSVLYDDDDLDSFAADPYDQDFADSVAAITPLQLAQGVANSDKVTRQLLKHLTSLTLLQQQAVIPLLDIPLLVSAFQDNIPLQFWPSFVRMMTQAQRQALLVDANIPLKNQDQKTGVYAKKNCLEREMAVLRKMKDYNPAFTTQLVTLEEKLQEVIQQIKEQAPPESIPEEYLDPLTCEVMQDAVRLPSGNIVDRSTLAKLNGKDSFTKEPFELSELGSEDALQAKIEAWRAESA